MDLTSLLLVAGILIAVVALHAVAAGSIAGSGVPARGHTVPSPARARKRLRVECPITGQLEGIDVAVQIGTIPRLRVLVCERFGDRSPVCREECLGQARDTVASFS